MGFKKSYLSAFKQAENVIVVSHYTRERLMNEQGLNPQQAIILPNSFDGRQFEIKYKPIHLLQRYQRSPKPPIIVTVSRTLNCRSPQGILPGATGLSPGSRFT